MGSTERDAVDFTGAILGDTHRLYKRLEAALPSIQAAQIEAYINQMYIDVGRMADSELEAGIIEAALKRNQ